MPKSVIQVELFSGEVAHVEPLSPFTVVALNEAARNAHPDVDTTPFQKPVEHAAPGLGLTTLDDKNPELLKLQADVREARTEYVTNAAWELNVCFEDKEALIRKYADKLKQLGKFIDLPVDVWQATLKHAIVTRMEDRDNINRALFSNAALEGGEIEAGMRVFRLKVQG